MRLAPFRLPAWGTAVASVTSNINYLAGFDDLLLGHQLFTLLFYFFFRPSKSPKGVKMVSIALLKNSRFCFPISSSCASGLPN